MLIDCYSIANKVVTLISAIKCVTYFTRRRLKLGWKCLRTNTKLNIINTALEFFVCVAFIFCIQTVNNIKQQVWHYRIALHRENWQCTVSCWDGIQILSTINS